MGRSVLADVTKQLPAFLSHDPYPGPQWCLWITFSTYFVTLQPMGNYLSLANTCTSIARESIVLIPWIQSWRSLSREFISVKLLICGKLSISIFFVAMANAANGDLPTYRQSNCLTGHFSRNFRKSRNVGMKNCTTGNRLWKLTTRNFCKNRKTLISLWDEWDALRL